VGDNGCTLLDIVPLVGISSTKFSWSIKLHLKSFTLSVYLSFAKLLKLIMLFFGSELCFLYIWLLELTTVHFILGFLSLHFELVPQFSITYIFYNSPRNKKIEYIFAQLNLNKYTFYFFILPSFILLISFSFQLKPFSQF